MSRGEAKPVRERTFIGNSRCRRPGCNRPAEIRGLCESDYRGTNREINKGTFEDAELVAKGKLEPQRTTLKDWLKS